MSLMKLLRSLWNTLLENELAMAEKSEVNILVLGMHTLFSSRVLSYPRMDELDVNPLPDTCTPLAE